MDMVGYKIQRGRGNVSAIEVRPVNQGFGAEINGIDLSHPLSGEAFNIWNMAFLEQSVVILRGQHFNEEQHIAFSEKFGTLEVFVDPKDQARGYPNILRVTNIDQDTNELKPVDDLGHKSFTLGTSDWHTDSSFKRVMSKASLLYGIEIPSRGGDTAFANTAMAFSALPAARQQELEKMWSSMTSRRHDAALACRHATKRSAAKIPLSHSRLSPACLMAARRC